MRSNVYPGQLKALAAMATNRVIGQRDRIPWHLPEDFRWFKRTTMGQVLLMGRKTFESIGRPLPGRTTLVLSQSGFAYPGVATVPDLAALPPIEADRTIFVCGGAEIYRLTLPACSELFLTQVKRAAEGNVLFPPFEDRFEQIETIMDTTEFRIVHYRNRAPVPVSSLPASL